MSTRGAVAVIAGLLVVVGVIVGFLPHSTLDPDLQVSVPCGSAFSPDGTFLACGSALSGPRWAAIGIAAVGLVAGLFLLLTMKPVRDAGSDRGAVS
jgi:hypothetical protein